jgi:hypothetical protein
MSSPARPSAPAPAPAQPTTVWARARASLHDHQNVAASSARRVLTFPVYNFSCLLAAGSTLHAAAFVRNGPRAWYRGIGPGWRFGVCKEFVQLSLLRRLNPLIDDSSAWKPVAQTAVAVTVDGVVAPVTSAVHKVRMGHSAGVRAALREYPQLYWPQHNHAANIMAKGTLWWLTFTSINHMLADVRVGAAAAADTHWHTALKGGCAGIVASAATYPLDVIRLRALHRNDAAPTSVVRESARLLGRGALFRGLAPYLMSGAVSASVTAVVIQSDAATAAAADVAL